MTSEGVTQLDAELERALVRLRQAIFKYPMATQSVFSLLVAEGREYAKTPEGAEWRARLAQAKVTGRARMLWQTLSLGTFVERDNGPLPGELAEALARILRRRHVEPLLGRLLGRLGRP